MSAERGATGSIPSCPANGEREAMVGTDRRKEKKEEEEGDIQTETEKAEAARCGGKETE